VGTTAHPGSGAQQCAQAGKREHRTDSTARPAIATAALDFHPIADIFPLMEGEEFDALVADIKKRGQQARIVLKDGMILDGRNRYRACLAAGIEPMFACKAYSDQITDPVAFVVAANIRRRHLKPEDKIKILAQLVAAKPERSDRQLAKETGVSHPTIAKARRAAEATGKALPVDKRTGADGKARRRPATKRAKKATSPPARARHDIGPASTGEVERLRARVDELQAEKRQLEIKITGLKSEVEELKAENAELRAKLEAAGASQQRPSTNGKGKEENGAGGNDALASAGKRKAAYALDDGSDPGPIPECLRRGAS
jgi:ParB-like chromosome segregation protein Spo0J